jgi:hypothetical protein
MSFRLFEIHEQRWFPQFLRDQFVDGLQMLLEVMSAYAPISQLLRTRLRESGTDCVVDLCSGAGGPWHGLLHDFEMFGAAPLKVILTDKFPATRNPEDRKKSSAKRVYYVEHPIDALQVPQNLRGFRTLFSSFHHFSRDEAIRLLQDSVDRRQGIGIFEAPALHPLTLAALFFIPVAMWIFTPLHRPFSWSRLLWTYLIPVIPFVLFFDGVVSCLRAYTIADLAQMVSGLSGTCYRWEIGEEIGDLLPLPITYLIGFPLNAPAEPGD